MKKRVMALVLSLAMLASNCTVALAGEDFTDTAEAAVSLAENSEEENSFTENFSEENAAAGDQDSESDIFTDEEQNVENGTEITAQDETVNSEENEIAVTPDEMPGREESKQSVENAAPDSNKIDAAETEETNSESGLSENEYDLQAEEILSDSAAASISDSEIAGYRSQAKSYEGHDYLVVKKQLSWDEAEEIAEQAGGHLATVTSSGEQAFLESLNTGRAWIGGYRDDNFNWYWITGETWDYTHWGSGEPNNSKNVINNENRVALWPKYWNDLNTKSTEQSGFVIEWDNSNVQIKLPASASGTVGKGLSITANIISKTFVPSDKNLTWSVTSEDGGTADFSFGTKDLYTSTTTGNYTVTRELNFSKAGTYTLKVAASTGAFATCKITITDSTIVLEDVEAVYGEPAAVTAKFKSSDFVPSASNLTWRLDGGTVATLTCQNLSVARDVAYSYIVKGKITFKKIGTYTLKLTTSEGETATSTVVVKPSKLQNLKLEATCKHGNSHIITLTWKEPEEQKQLSGYEIEYSKNSDFSDSKKETVVASKTDSMASSVVDANGSPQNTKRSYVLKDLDKETIYYVRIRGYKEDSKNSETFYEGEWAQESIKTDKLITIQDLWGFENPTIAYQNFSVAKKLSSEKYSYLLPSQLVALGIWWHYNGSTAGQCYGLCKDAIRIWNGSLPASSIGLRNDLNSYHSWNELPAEAQNVIYGQHLSQHDSTIGTEYDFNPMKDALYAYKAGVGCDPILVNFVSYAEDSEYSEDYIHTMIALDYEEIEEDVYRLYVYDPNFPYPQSGWDERYIEISYKDLTATYKTGKWGTRTVPVGYYGEGTYSRFYWKQDHDLRYGAPVKEAGHAYLMRSKSKYANSSAKIRSRVDWSAGESNGGTENLYWIEKQEDFSFSNLEAGDEIGITSYEHEVVISANQDCAATIHISDTSDNKVTFTGKPGTAVSVDFISYDDNYVQHKNEVTGTIGADGTVTFTSNGTMVIFTGVTSIKQTTKKTEFDDELNEKVLSEKSVQKDSLVGTKKYMIPDSSNSDSDKMTVCQYIESTGVYCELSSEASTCNHQYETRIVKNKTCTVDGLSIEFCKLCDTMKEGSEKTIPHGHNYNLISTQNATVFHGTIKQYVCQDCGNKYSATWNDQLKGFIKMNYTSIKLKVNQSTTKVKVTGMASGDSVASWKSLNTKIATVTNSGKITGKKAGTTKIRITLKSGVSADVTVKVQKTAVQCTAIKLNSTKVTLAVGKTYQLTSSLSPVTCVQKVTYKSANTKVATVSSAGKITAKKKGTAVITVKAGSKSVKCKVTVTSKVTLKLSRYDLTMRKGDNDSITATVTGTNEKVVWKSSNPSAAVVGSTGKIVAKKKGTAVITASVGGQTAKCKVTVTATRYLIKLSKNSLTLNNGGYYYFSWSVTGAPGATETWKSSNPSVASVKPGAVYAHKTGTATITVTAGDATAKCVVTVK